MEFLGDSSETDKKTMKKKRFHRHTPHQIQRLESYSLFLYSIVFSSSFFLFSYGFCLQSFQRVSTSRWETEDAT